MVCVIAAFPHSLREQWGLLHHKFSFFGFSVPWWPLSSSIFLYSNYSTTCISAVHTESLPPAFLQCTQSHLFCNWSELVRVATVVCVTPCRGRHRNHTQRERRYRPWSARVGWKLVIQMIQAMLTTVFRLSQKWNHKILFYKGNVST